ncbi:MAG TPA: TlpA disulfide reductase family protein [Burkholderiales bacterium]|nr:TlpA disulfide reductase family protein [Burkholderiales bacterium]
MAYRLKHGLILVAAAAAGVAAFLLSRSLDGERKPAPPAAPTQAVKPAEAIPDKGGQALLAATFPDLEGREQPLSQWKGKVLVVNFWATWCEPCKKEIPEFVKIQAKYSEKGVRFVGVALDEREKVQAMSLDLGINYPVLIAPLSAIGVSREAGNDKAALPFTAILDRSGRVVSSKLGGLNEAKLEAIISPLI